MCVCVRASVCACVSVNVHVCSGVTRPGPTRAWARVSADLLAVAVWILQIAIIRR